MKKTAILIIISLLLSLLLQAQSYERLNYQGVLKNPDGSIRPNTQVTVTLEFVQDGNVVYSEMHNVTTNANGYFALHPGGGESITGCFTEIDWGEAPISMRSIIDGNLIAESYMTSVPYALYAMRVRGQEGIISDIDSVGIAHQQTALQVDELILTTDTLLNNTDVAHRRIDSIHVTIDSTHCLIDSLFISVSHLSEKDSVLAQELAHLSHRTDSLSASAVIFNATTFRSLPLGQYHTRLTATQAVPQHLRKSGLVVTFRADTLGWYSLQYTHNDTTQWHNENHWVHYGNYGNIVIPFNTNNALTRLQIPTEYRKPGLIISYFNNTDIINEQYILSHCEDSAWSNDKSWVQLLFTSREIDKMKSEIARIDTLVNDVKKGMQDMSTFGAWFYIGHNEQFSQAGAIDREGNEVSDLAMVHTPLLPIEDTWFVTTYSNNTYPGISFFSEKDPDSRLPYIGDTTSTDNWQQMTIDFSTDEIPHAARYFSVNMLLDKKDYIELKKRTPITNVIDTSIKHAFQEQSNSFTYIGAYVGCNGRRVINSQFRHSRYFTIDETVYKVQSNGCYSQDFVAPVIVYYSDISFNSAVAYDLGEVGADSLTSREIIVSRETAPEGAMYFIVNCIPGKGSAHVYTGQTTESAINNADTRIASLENNLSCHAGRKLVTIGDSFTSNSGNRGKSWQQWLSEWLGATWSQEETLYGVNGHCAMGVGGSWVMPNDINSMSLRCQKIHRYSPNLILIYGGQNDKIDKFPLGSIEDKPFIPSQTIDLTNRSTVNSLQQAIDYMTQNNTNLLPNTILHINVPWGKQLYYIEDTTSWNKTESWEPPINTVTFYAAYKGMVEYVCKHNPYASIYCMTLMQCDSTRYDDSLGNWDELDKMRRAKCEAIKEIAQYYGVHVIDLWNKSGVTPYNASSLYSDWLHPNQYGYRRLAECVYHEIK